MSRSLLSWRDGAGWLILAGSVDGQTDTRSQVLARLKPDGAVAYLGLHVDHIESLMDDMEDLGAPTGYFVNILTEDDTTIETRLRDAACIVLPSITPLEDFYSALMGAALRAMRDCYARGGVIYAEGASAMLFGAWFVDSIQAVRAGLNWIEDAFILPDVTSVSESSIARSILIEGKARLALGIGHGSGVALGANGQLIPIGARQVTIILGNVPHPSSQ